MSEDYASGDDFWMFTTNEFKDSQYWFWQREDPSSEYGYIASKLYADYKDYGTVLQVVYVCEGSTCKIKPFEVSGNYKQMWKWDGNAFVSDWHDAKMIVHGNLGLAAYKGSRDVSDNIVTMNDKTHSIYNSNFEGNLCLIYLGICQYFYTEYISIPIQNVQMTLVKNHHLLVS